MSRRPNKLHWGDTADTVQAPRTEMDSRGLPSDRSGFRCWPEGGLHCCGRARTRRKVAASVPNWPQTPTMTGRYGVGRAPAAPGNSYWMGVPGFYVRRPSKMLECRLSFTLGRVEAQAGLSRSGSKPLQRCRNMAVVVSAPRQREKDSSSKVGRNLHRHCPVAPSGEEMGSLPRGPWCSHHGEVRMASTDRVCAGCCPMATSPPWLLTITSPCPRTGFCLLPTMLRGGPSGWRKPRVFGIPWPALAEG